MYIIMYFVFLQVYFIVTISLSLVALIAVSLGLYYRGAGPNRLCYTRYYDDGCWNSLLDINMQPTWYDLTVISINVLVIFASCIATCAIKYYKKKLIYATGGVILSMAACQIIPSLALGGQFLYNNQPFPVTDDVSSEISNQLFASLKDVQANTASKDIEDAWMTLEVDHHCCGVTGPKNYGLLELPEHCQCTESYYEHGYGYDYDLEGDCITDVQNGTYMYSGCLEVVLRQLRLWQIPVFEIQILIVLLVSVVQFMIVVIATCTASCILPSVGGKVVWNDLIDDQEDVWYDNTDKVDIITS